MRRDNLHRPSLVAIAAASCFTAALAAAWVSPAMASATAKPPSSLVTGAHPGLDDPSRQPSSFDTTNQPTGAVSGTTRVEAAQVPATSRELAGHLLRRIGFGPTEKDVKTVMKHGLTWWIDHQLEPSRINDGASESKLPRKPNNPDEDGNYIRRWYVRMATSRRQLQEKMTLIWHEHFATSDEKVVSGLLMNDQEEMLRENGLGRFRDLLITVTKDQAMLIWLDNDSNDGRGEEPPNENYAREFLQLFTTGTVLLNLDGTPQLDDEGHTLPAYSENDVREIARALTGWYVPWPRRSKNTRFTQWNHDEDPKTIMGVTLPGRSADDGANEVEDVVDLVLQQRSTTVAAFISRSLIEKLATETPSPGYVSDVASVFLASGGDLKQTVRAILVHPEFTDPSVVGTQYKEPIEQFVGAVRALGGKTGGEDLIEWTYDAGQLVYYPPSVFSFYPPGHKETLLNTAFVFVRDKMADEFVRGDGETTFDAAKMIKKNKLRTPEQTVDFLSAALLSTSLRDEARGDVIAYMNGVVDEETVRGAVWLILCSPEFQKN